MSIHAAGDIALPLTPPQGVEPTWLRIRLTTWLKIATVAVLMGLLFRFNLRRLWLKTNPIDGEANWGHAICVPLIGLYYLYVNRDQLLKAKVKAAWSGLGVLLLGLGVFQYGIWPGRNDWTSDFGMVVTLFGAVLLLGGWEVMKVAWFPIVFLVCALPWPGLVYSWIAMPLQTLAAKAAVATLQITGVAASSGGTKINIGGTGGEPLRTLNVAEACAGLRSLMTFISVGAAVGFLSTRDLWQKLLITASAVPIAIFCNVMRVAGQGLLDHYVSRELSESFAHQFVGLIMLIPAFFMILGVGWLLDRLIVEEVDVKPAPAGTPVASLPQTSTDVYQQWVLPQSKRNAKSQAVKKPLSKVERAAQASMPAVKLKNKAPVSGARRPIPPTISPSRPREEGK